MCYLLFSFTIKISENYVGLIALFFNGVFYILSYTLFFWGFRFIGVTRTSVLSLIDPIFTTVIAMIFLNQFLPIIESLRFTVVLLFIYFFERLKITKKS